MASLINNGSFSFNQEELKDLSQVINELSWNDRQLNELHDVVEGIKYNEQIVFAGRMGLIGKAVTGCTPNEIGGITLTEKTWTPIREDFRLKQCSTDVNAQDKLINQMAKMNPDFYNIIEGSQSSVGQYLVAKVIEVLPEEILRKVWFNDTSANTVVNGGVLTNGTDAGYFDTFNGLFKQITADTNVPYVEITKNSGASYVAQELASGDALATLRAMYKKADKRLIKSGQAKFYVTSSIFDAYIDDLENIQNSGAGNTTITENGQMTAFFKGIEVLEVNLWDRVIEAYEDNGTTLNLPNRAILSTKDNLKVGTLASGDFGEIDAFYDRVTKTNYMDGIYSIDAKHMESYLTVKAY
jgi:hypothetical protein